MEDEAWVADYFSVVGARWETNVKEAFPVILKRAVCSLILAKLTL